MRKCIICGKRTRYRFNFLCRDHYFEFKAELKAPWIRFLIADEQRQRYQAMHEPNLISLESIAELEDK